MQFKTITKETEGIYKKKGSKFIAVIFPVHSEEAFLEKLQAIKEAHSSARHCCYAYRLEPEGKIFRANDDGEPSGTAGKPILNQLLSAEITNTAVVVVRYFGGTKLGASGLIRAYKEATIDAINVAEVVTNLVHNYFLIEFSYDEMPSVMKWVRQNNLETEEQKFNLNCSLVVKHPIEKDDQFLKKLPLNTKYKLLKTA